MDWSLMTAKYYMQIDSFHIPVFPVFLKWTMEGGKEGRKERWKGGREGKRDEGRGRDEGRERDEGRDEGREGGREHTVEVSLIVCVPRLAWARLPPCTFQVSPFSQPLRVASLGTLPPVPSRDPSWTALWPPTHPFLHSPLPPRTPPTSPTQVVTPNSHGVKYIMSCVVVLTMPRVFKLTPLKTR